MNKLLLTLATATLTASCAAPPVRTYEAADTSAGESSFNVTEFRVFTGAKCLSGEEAVAAALGAVAANLVSNVVVDLTTAAIAKAKAASESKYETGNRFQTSDGLYLSDAGDNPKLNTGCILLVHGSFGSSAQATKVCPERAKSAQVLDRLCAAPEGLRPEDLGLLGEPNFYLEVAIQPDASSHFFKMTPVFLAQRRHPGKSSIWNRSGKGTANIAISLFPAGKVGDDTAFAAHVFAVQDLKNGIYMDAERLTSYQSPFFAMPPMSAADQTAQQKFREGQSAVAKAPQYKVHLAAIASSLTYCTAAPTDPVQSPKGCDLDLANYQPAQSTAGLAGRTTATTYPAETSLYCENALADPTFLRQARENARICSDNLDATVWDAFAAQQAVGIPKDDAQQLADLKSELLHMKQDYARRRTRWSVLAQAAQYTIANCAKINTEVDVTKQLRCGQAFEEQLPVSGAPAASALFPFTVRASATWAREPNKFLVALDKAVTDNKDKVKTALEEKLRYQWDSDFRDEQKQADLLKEARANADLQAALDAVTLAQAALDVTKAKPDATTSDILAAEIAVRKAKLDANKVFITNGKPAPFADLLSTPKA